MYYLTTKKTGIESIAGESKIKNDHKHLMWTPDEPHKIGISKEIKTEMVISEVPTLSPLRKVLPFGLKPFNVVFINNPSLKAGVNHMPDIRGFSPKHFIPHDFSE